MDSNNLYFTPIEVSRLIGMDKRGLYNKREAGIVMQRLIEEGEIRKPLGLKKLKTLPKTCMGFRRGRRKPFPEILYQFEEVVKLCPEFKIDHESRIFSMFRLQTGLYAFKVIEACRIAGVSHQWVQRLILNGEIERISGLRELKTAPESLIRLSGLRKLLNGRIGKIINIEEEILNLFRLVTE